MPSKLDKGRVPRGIREQHLLDVAADAFGALGFHGTSLERVARDAGVSRQYVAKLFGDKTGLYVACHARARRRLDEALTGAAADHSVAPPQDDQAAQGIIEAVATAYFRFVADEGSSWDVLFGGGPDVDGPAAEQIAAMRTHTIGLLAQLLRTSRPAVTDADAAFAAEAMSGAAAQHAHTLRRRTIDPADSGRRFARLFWSGVADL